MKTTKLHYLVSKELRKSINQVIDQQKQQDYILKEILFENHIQLEFQQLDLNEEVINIRTIIFENQVYEFDTFYKIRKYVELNYIENIVYEDEFNLSTNLPYEYFKNYYDKSEFQTRIPNTYIYNSQLLLN